MSKIIDVINIKTVLDGSEKIPFGHVSDKIVLLVSGIKTHVLTGLNSSNISDFSVAVSGNADVLSNTNNRHAPHTNRAVIDLITNAGSGQIITATERSNIITALSDSASAKSKTDQITITSATDLDAIRTKVNGINIADNQNIITNAQIALLNKFNLAHTKQVIAGTGVQIFNLNNGWLADSTISGNQTLDFSNASLGANGVVKLINTDGNTLTLSGSGITFKKSVEGVLEANAPITLEAGATTEQLLVFSFQSATECIYQIK